MNDEWENVLQKAMNYEMELKPVVLQPEPLGILGATVAICELLSQNKSHFTECQKKFNMFGLRLNLKKN